MNHSLPLLLLVRYDRFNMAKIIKDISGFKFGKLTVLSFYGRKKSYKYWNCICECGSIKEYKQTSLDAGDSTSCGCTRMAKMHEKSKIAKTIHGKTSGGNSKIYRIWANMLTRCTNPKASNWKWYGGRGIKVCESWQTFSNFYADMGDCPENLTLDRIDVNGEYSKQNCRWADWQTQVGNRRKIIKNEQ